MQSSGRERDQRVTGFHAMRAQKFAALDCADDESGEIVFTGFVKIGHLRGFAADKSTARGVAGAADAFENFFDDRGIHFSESEIVEKKSGSAPRVKCH